MIHRSQVGRHDLLVCLRAMPEAPPEELAALFLYERVAQPKPEPLTGEPGPMPAPEPAPTPPPSPPSLAPQIEFLVPEKATGVEGGEGRGLPEEPLQCEVLLGKKQGITEEELSEQPLPLPPKPPLRPWPRLWPFLRRALGCLRESRRVDTSRLLRQVARCRPVRRLPCHRYPGWADQARIVFDRRPDLALFWDDIESLLARLERERGREGLKVVRLRDGQPPADPPASGVPVLVLGDLGFYTQEESLMAAWRAHARALRRRGSAGTALLPCPRDRWRAESARVWACACWDRGQILPGGRRGVRALEPTPAGQLGERARRLLTMLSPAVRVERGLLRAVRLLQGTEADVGTEYDAWRHTEAANDGVRAMGVRAAHAAQRRAEFSSLALETKAAVFGLIQRWHEGCAETIRQEEILYLAECGAPVPPDAIETARTTQNRAAATLLGLARQGGLGLETARAAGFFDWQRRGFSRASAGARRIEEHLAMGWVAIRWLSGAEVSQVSADMDPVLVGRALGALLPDPGRETLWEVGQQGSRLVLAPWRPPAERPGGPAWAAGAPIAWVRARKFYFQVTIQNAAGKWGAFAVASREATVASLPIGRPRRLGLVSDLATLEVAAWTRPPWASRLGRDRFGLFAEFEIAGVLFRMRWIPPGSFRMGSPTTEKGRWDDEGPQHLVTITRGFWLGEAPCTQAQWQAAMPKNPSEFKGARRPVDSVTWHDCAEYCERLASRVGALVFRLPTEAEWEYACRAGTGTAFNDGTDCTEPEGQDPALDRLGWFDKNSGQQTHPVGEKAPNPWGLYDTHGNVWEWCADSYGVEAVTDPAGPEGEGARRVVRGGCYWNNARFCRSAYRNSFGPGFRRRSLGFRLAAGQELKGGVQEEVFAAGGALGFTAGGVIGPEAGGAAAPGPEAPAGGPERGAGDSKGRGAGVTASVHGEPSGLNRTVGPAQPSAASGGGVPPRARVEGAKRPLWDEPWLPEFEQRVRDLVHEQGSSPHLRADQTGSTPSGGLWARLRALLGKRRPRGPGSKR